VSRLLPIRAISTTSAPAAIGPYNQAVIAGGFIFVSGQIPLDPVSGALVPGDISVQTTRVLENLSAILVAAGSSLPLVVKTTVYLADLSNFQEMNEIYGRYFPGTSPARATIQAVRLPRDAGIEIDAIAVLPDPS
jgi:2-iminobutanoate/2-iminopropanoate deaminase